MNGAIRITDADQLRVAIADLRVMSCMTQRALAAESGFRQAQISSWLTGRMVPDPSSVIRLVNALGYDLALVPREEPTPVVHTTPAELATERFWSEHVDPVAREHGIDVPALTMHADPGDTAQHLLKDAEGRLLLVVRTDREDA